ncbi:MAG: CHAT domain-containing tetratricopeptide repeat protein [Candidatus Eisenbacteria bacterium]
MKATVRGGVHHARPRRRFPIAACTALLLLVVCAPLHAQVSTDSIRTLYRRGRADQAEPLVRAALARTFARTHADSLARAEWADLFAEAQWRQRRRTPAADSIADVAVALRLRLHGPESEPYAISLGNQARLWRSSRSPDSSVAGLRRAIGLLERVAPGSLTSIADLLVAWGNVLRETGAYVPAVAALERAVELRRRALGPGDRDVARALINLGLAYDASGRQQQRVVVERQAYEILEHATPVDSLALYFTARNLTGSLYGLHRPLEAGPFVARCLELGARFVSPVSQDAADDEENAGIYQYSAGDLPSAQRHFDRAGAIYATRGPGLLPGSEARYWLNRAPFEAVAGRLDSAWVCAERASRGLEALYRQRPSIESGAAWASALERCGQVLAARGELAAAAAQFRAAAELYSTHSAPGHPDAASCWAEFAAVHMRAGQLDSVAAPGLRSAVALTRHVRREFSTMSEQEALESRTRGARPVLQVLLSLLCTPQGAPAVRDVWDAYVNDRGIVLAELSARRDLLHAAEGRGVDTLARELTSVRARLGSVELRPHSAEDLAPLRTRALELEQKLAAGNSRLAADFARQRATVSAVAAALPSHTTLVHYVRFMRSGLPASKPGSVASDWDTEFLLLGRVVPWYAAFVLRSGETVPRFVSLGPAHAIEPELQTWQRMLARGARASGAEREAGKRLREQIWDPLDRWIAASELVLIVPDGPLAVLPFATLPRADGAPLLERGPTLHMLEEAQTIVPGVAVAPTGRALLVGGVDHGEPLAAGSPAAPGAARVRGWSARCESVGLPAFGSLPGSVDEMRHVAASWRAAHAREPEQLTGRAASEAALRASAPGSELLHLATHGFFLPDSCRLRGVDPQPMFADLRSSPLPPGPGEALLRTGVVLAGANAPGADATNDGILTAADIAMLDLSSERLVVLSACETGLGALSDAEGVLGLRSALRQAGARASITSLHRISDEATARWMALFYDGWLGRQRTLPDAARDAARALRRELLARGEGDRPGVWGAFIASGEWR